MQCPVLVDESSHSLLLCEGFKIITRVHICIQPASADWLNVLPHISHPALQT